MDRRFPAISGMSHLDRDKAMSMSEGPATFTLPTMTDANSKSSRTVWYNRYVYHSNDRHTSHSKLTKPRETESTSYNSSINAIHPLTRSRFLLPGFRKSSNPEVSLKIKSPARLRDQFRQPLQAAVHRKTTDYELHRPSRPKMATARSCSRSRVNVINAPDLRNHGADQERHPRAPTYSNAKLPDAVHRYELRDGPRTPSSPQWAGIGGPSRLQTLEGGSCSPPQVMYRPRSTTHSQSQILPATHLRDKPPQSPDQLCGVHPYHPARITTRPLRSREVNAPVPRRLSQRRTPGRSCTRRKINKTPDHTSTLAPMHQESRFSNSTHLDIKPSRQREHASRHDHSELSAKCVGWCLDDAPDGVPERTVGLVRSRHRKNGPRCLQRSRNTKDRFPQRPPPTRSKDLEVNEDCRMPTNKTKCIQEQLAMDEHRHIESTELPSLRPWCSSQPLMPPLPFIGESTHQKFSMVDQHAQSNLSREGVEPDNSRSSSDQGLECDIIDLYADLYPSNSEDDGLWTEVEDILRVMESPTCRKDSNWEGKLVSSIPTTAIRVPSDSRPPRVQVKSSPSVHRQASSVCDVKLHPDVSRVVNSLRDGTSLDSFVLERIHSCASSSG